MTATEWISLFSLFIVIKTENEGWMPHKWSLIFVLLSDSIWKLFLKAVSSLWDQEGNCEVRLVLKMWSEVFSLQTGWDRMLTRSWRYNSSLDEPASRSSNDLFFFPFSFALRLHCIRFQFGLDFDVNELAKKKNPFHASSIVTQKPKLNLKGRSR